MKSHLCSTNPSIVQTGLKDKITRSVMDNEDMQFLWSIIAANWVEKEGNELLRMITEQWITLRGFSFASSFNEEYKKQHQKTLEKSKGIRKSLIGS